MNPIPLYIPVIFLVIVFFTLFIFYLSMRDADSAQTRIRAGFFLGVLSAWILVQAVMAYKNIYVRNLMSFPPRLMWAVMSTVLVILIAFLTKSGKKFIDSLSLKYLTWLHVIRLPVELTLYGLFIYGNVPEIMTFTGRNFDIVAGLTAPILIYTGWKKGKRNNGMLLTWNLIALALLLNIVVLAVFSAPFEFQKFGLNQPNVAVLYFPYNLLPVFIVPIVLFSHLVAIRQILQGRKIKASYKF